MTFAIALKISPDPLTHLCRSLCSWLSVVKLTACQMVSAKSKLLGRQITYEHKDNHNALLSAGQILVKIVRASNSDLSRTR